MFSSVLKSFLYLSWPLIQLKSPGESLRRHRDPRGGDHVFSLSIHMTLSGSFSISFRWEDPWLLWLTLLFWGTKASWAGLCISKLLSAFWKQAEALARESKSCHNYNVTISCTFIMSINVPQEHPYSWTSWVQHSYDKGGCAPWGAAVSQEEGIRKDL